MKHLVGQHRKNKVGKRGKWNTLRQPQQCTACPLNIIRIRKKMNCTVQPSMLVLIATNISAQLNASFLGISIKPLVYLFTHYLITNTETLASSQWTCIRTHTHTHTHTSFCLVGLGLTAIGDSFEWLRTAHRVAWDKTYLTLTKTPHVGRVEREHCLGVCYPLHQHFCFCTEPIRQLVSRRQTAWKVLNRLQISAKAVLILKRKCRLF